MNPCNYLRRIVCLGILSILSIALGPAVMGSDTEEETGPLKFGVLPVIQALPVFVAAEKGFFKESGIEVEIVPFNSGMEKDVAMSAGAISGYFGDLMTPMVLRANGVPVKIVSTIFQTTPTQRMFAVLAAPGSADKSLEELIEEGIAGSSNTIIEYILHRILKSEGLPVERFTMIETKRIPIRLQMLLSNQVPAATLPEPLAAFAETKGAKVLLDDAGRGISSTVLAFREDYISERPEAVKRFHKAIDKAVEFIRENPKEARRIMNRNCRVPGSIKERFAIPIFPPLAPPTPEAVMAVHDWLYEKGIIRNRMTYDEMVDDALIP